MRRTWKQVELDLFLLAWMAPLLGAVSLASPIVAGAIRLKRRLFKPKQ